MILRLANGRELRGAVRDPMTGAVVWSAKGTSRAFLERMLRELDERLRPGSGFGFMPNRNRRRR